MPKEEAQGGPGKSAGEEISPEPGSRPAVEPSSEPPFGEAETERSPAAVAQDVMRLVEDIPCSPVPRARRVFVNRNLRMDLVESVGFDMDYTLAVYHHRRVESLAYRMTAESLVREKGYPRNVLDLAYQPNTVIRGLVVDKEQGNIFKMDRHYHVARVHHGRRPLSKEERVERYRKQKVRLGSKRYVWVDTLFALPEVALYSDLVDLFDKRRRGSGGRVDYAGLYQDVRETIDAVHRDGSLKRVIEEDLPYYIRREPEIGSALHRLRSSGKRLFLLTNSHWDYTDAVMSFLLDGVLQEYASWRGYFDLVLVGADKPGFFGENRPFFEVDTNTGSTRPSGPILRRGGVYQGGNLRDLESATGWRGDSVLYVGDHIYGDILRTKRSGMWRTAMVVQEVEEEIRYMEAKAEDLALLRQLEALRIRIDDEIAMTKSLVSDLERRLTGLFALRTAAGGRGRRRHVVELRKEHLEARADLDRLKRSLKEVLAAIDDLEEDIQRGMNPNWGMLFKEGHENSRFAEQVEAYACVYTGRVSNLLFYSPERYFRSRPSPMPHETESPSDTCLG